MTHALKVAYEAIDHQYNSPLFHDINVHIEECFSTKDRDLNALFRDKSQIFRKLIAKHTGLNVQVKMVSGLELMVKNPIVYKNNVLLNDFERSAIQNDITVQNVWKKGVLSGEIDRAKGVVSGIFSEVEYELEIGKMFFKSSLGFNSKQVTSGILHEIGHAFTQLEFLSYQISTNFIVNQTTRKMLNLDDQKSRIELLREVEEANDLDIEEKDRLTVKNDENVIKTVLLSTLVKKMNSELGSYKADKTGWESLADQFSSRHGGGRHTIELLYNLYRLVGHQTLLSRRAHLSLETSRMAIMVLGATFVPALAFMIGAVFLIHLIDIGDVYDTPPDRFKRIRRDMVDSLKNNNVGTEERKRIQDDIARIDELIEKVNDHRNFFDAFWDFTIPSRRKRVSQLKFQQDVEDLLNNDLYYRASQFKTFQ